MRFICLLFRYMYICIERIHFICHMVIYKILLCYKAMAVNIFRYESNDVNIAIFITKLNTFQSTLSLQADSTSI